MTDTLVVDLCGTIVHENTTHGFVRASSLRLSRNMAARVLLSRAGFRATRLFGVDVHRSAVIGCLNGSAYTQLTRDATRYAERTLSTRGRASVLEKIRLARAADRPVLLASASLDVVVEAFAAALGAQAYVASRLAYDERGACRGLLTEDATGQKLALLERLVGPLGAFEVVTDNPEDTDLMAAATKVHFIRGSHD